MATFTLQNASANVPTASFSAVIAWGDGDTTTSSGAISSQGNGVYNIAGSHTYTLAGDFTPTVTIYENGLPMGTTSFAVSGVPLNLEAAGRSKSRPRCSRPWKAWPSPA